MSDTAARRLATIVALDVAGYSARTEADEARTTAEVAALRRVIESIATKHGGRVFNTAGDGFMLEFGSSLAGVEAAIELAETCEPKVRVGVHLGDVAVQPNGDLLGHGVNVAARLMARSDPGSALVSGAVRQTIRGPITQRLQSRGMLKLDKMAETIEAFALGSPAAATKDVFLSYAREDQAVARKFAEALEREGVPVWWDVALRSGDAYDETMEQALKAAKAVVVLWSKTSVDSRWVRAEATHADRNKTLIPAMIEPCERPIMFELTQTAELSHWDGAPADKTWQAFLTDVRRVTGKLRTPEPASALQAQAATPATPPAKGERGDRPSLAVMPFANRSGQAADDVFAIGMVEDVIDALSLGVNVRVISSSATARFRNGAITDLEAMGRQLGVRYLLEGNVRRTGENLRVTAQLVEAASGGILWTQRFARPLSELASMQEDLVTELAARLDAQVYRIEMARALAKPADLTAWECITRAQASFRQLDPKSQATGIEDAARAVALAPEYGLAHAVLATTTALRYFVHSFPDAATESEVQKHIAQAFALDADNPAVLTYVAQALNFLGRPQDAIGHVERAIRTSPGYGYAYFVCAMSSQMLNRVDEALDHVESDLQFSPGSHLEYINWYYRAFAHWRQGDWAAAGLCIERSLALNPNPALSQFYKALVLNGQMRHVEAREAMGRARAAEPATQFELWDLRLRRVLINFSGLKEARAGLRKLWDETEPAA